MFIARRSFAVPFSVLLFVMVMAQATYAWMPASADCAPGDKKNVARYEASVRSAAPGDTVYAPFPYPRSDREIIADFVYHAKDVLDPEQPGRHYSGLPRQAGYDRLLRTLNAESARFEIARGEDWSYMRCSNIFPTHHYFVVRVYDRASGEEIARAQLADSGLLGHMVAPPTHPFADLAATGAEAADVFGLAVAEPQYIRAEGSIQCHESLVPCIAFKSANNDDVYIYAPTRDMYRISHAVKAFSTLGQVSAPEKLRSLEQSLAPNQRLVSIGATEYAIAERIAPR